MPRPSSRVPDAIRPVERGGLGGVGVQWPELFPQDTVLFFEILDHLLLLPVHPAGKGHEENVPRVLEHGRDFTLGGVLHERSRYARSFLGETEHGVGAFGNHGDRGTGILLEIAIDE